MQVTQPGDQLWNQAMQGTSPEDQIFNQFARNQKMHIQVAPSGGQIYNLCKSCHLVAKFATNTSGAIWWSNLQQMQVAPPSGGQIWK